MVVPNTFAALDLVSTVYLMSILTDHRRSIDRYIDYFGTGASGLEPRGAEARRPMCLNEDQEI